MRKATRHMTQHYDRHLAECGLTVTQFSILSHVGRLGPLTIGELAGRLAMDRTTLGRALGPLERDGLVTVGPDGRDGRRKALSLAPDGAARLLAARPLWTEAESRFDAAFGSDRARTLRDTLSAVLATDLAPPSAGPVRTSPRAADPAHPGTMRPTEDLKPIPPDAERL